MKARVGVLSCIAALVSLGAPAAANGAEMFAVLEPTEVFPGPGDPDASGAALIDVKVPKRRLCADVRGANLGEITSMYIANAPRFVTGPLEVNLMPIVNGRPCVRASKATLREIREPTNGGSTAMHYIQIGTDAFPGGALRGQIQRATT